MFNVGFGEIVVVLVIFIVTMDPSKLKEYFALIRFFYFKFHSLKMDILSQIGFLEKPNKYIFGDYGSKYESYDLNTENTFYDQSLSKSENEKTKKDSNNNIL